METLLRAGDVVGGFRVDDVIGIGGMAIVYRAEQVSLGRPVALKVLSRKLTNDAVFRERFRREGTHAAALEHPNIVPVYDSGEQDGDLYIAMRLIEGTNLAEVLQTRGLTADQTIELLRPIASALDAAHVAGLIHRDVKPQNILISSNGHPYLADFGVAKGSNTEGLTATGGFVGSIHYASPEQIKGLTLTPASDVYALTAVLYQCLTGRLPFPRETDAGVMHAHLHDPPPTLPVSGEADSDFHTVFARGMAKDPGSRYGHAGDMITAAAICVGRLRAESRALVPAFPKAAESTESAEAVMQTPVVGETEIIDDAEAVELRSGLGSTSADRRRAVASIPTGSSRRGVKSRRTLLAGGATLAIVGVGIAVLATGGSGNAQAGTLRGGDLVLRPGSQWRRSGAGVSELALAKPVRFSVGETRVDAGAVTRLASIPGSVPRSIEAAFGRPSRTKLVELPLGRAKTYSWTSDAHGPLTLLMIATERGELAIACTTQGAAASSELERKCLALGASAKVLGTTVEYPGADPRVASAIDKALEVRSKGLAQLSGASFGRSLPARAAALKAFAQADASAAAAVTSVKAPARASTAITKLAAGLTQESEQLSQLARAAGQNERSQYESLRSRLAGHTTGGISALAKIGFTGISAPSPRVLRAPAQPHKPGTRGPAPGRGEAPGGGQPPGGGEAPGGGQPPGGGNQGGGGGGEGGGGGGGG